MSYFIPCQHCGKELPNLPINYADTKVELYPWPGLWKN